MNGSLDPCTHPGFPGFKGGRPSFTRCLVVVPARGIVCCSTRHELPLQLRKINKRYSKRLLKILSIILCVFQGKQRSLFEAARHKHVGLLTAPLALKVALLAPHPVVFHQKLPKFENTANSWTTGHNPPAAYRKIDLTERTHSTMTNRFANSSVLSAAERAGVTGGASRFAETLASGLGVDTLDFRGDVLTKTDSRALGSDSFCHASMHSSSVSYPRLALSGYPVKLAFASSLTKITVEGPDDVTLKHKMEAITAAGFFGGDRGAPPVGGQTIIPAVLVPAVVHDEVPRAKILSPKPTSFPMLCPRPPILFPGPVLQPDSVEDFQCWYEHNDINQAWRVRDRGAVHSYEEFLAVRATKDTKLADRFGGVPHLPGVWHSYRNRDGTWGPQGGIMDASRWVTTTAATPRPSRRAPGTRDPDWDGTPVAKTPGKAKCRRRRMMLELQEDAAIAAAELEAAWSYDVWFATWGHNSTWGKRGDGTRL
ncbi:hypothetical protein DFH06DRAFT_1148217 [Mycena polygramma]|nr:hypothetical protein DFH06DRAFT_1148217 [Mycena polygramma]